MHRKFDSKMTLVGNDKVPKYEGIKQVIAEFVSTLMEEVRLRNCHKLPASHLPNIFEAVDCHDLTKDESQQRDNVFSISGGDLILGHYWNDAEYLEKKEFGIDKIEIKKVDYESVTTFEIAHSLLEKYYIPPPNWNEMIRSLKILRTDSMALIALSGYQYPKEFYSSLESALNTADLSLDAIFDIEELGTLGSPEYDFYPPIYWPRLFVISRRSKSKLFLSNLISDNYFQEVLNNYSHDYDSGNLVKGMIVDRKSFESYEREEQKQRPREEIEKLKLAYSDYEVLPFKEIIINVNTVDSDCVFKGIENSVYLHQRGKSVVFTEAIGEIGFDSEFFQIVLNQRVSNKYVSIFLNSLPGNAILNSAMGDKCFLLDELIKLPIAVPPKSSQRNIAKVHSKIGDLIRAFDRYKNESISSPISAGDLLPKLDNVLKELDKLSAADEIISLLRNYELSDIEYKDALNVFGSNWKDLEGTKPVLKTLVAFMNSNGGILLIGVNDSREITGINQEVKEFHHNSVDRYLLRLGELIKTRIGKIENSFIEFDQPININGKWVLKITCSPSRKEPCFLDVDQFYVRQIASTSLLKTPEFHEYWQNRISDL